MSVKILVVDDEVLLQKLIQSRFRKEIRAKEFDFSYALNGQEALNVLEEQPEVEIILCDINMPVMDGLTLLTHLRKMPRILRTIMVTAYGNMNNIRAAMNQGAFDFVTKPIDFGDLKITIQKAVEEIAQLKEGEEARRQLPITQEKLEQTDQKARHLEELDLLKSRFFANISHEFRTPLTVILGMADQILRDSHQWASKGAGMIRQNAEQLLDLVNQILDLQKLESGELQVKLQQGEIVSFLQYVSESFQLLATQKGIQLSFESNQEELWMDFDSEKMLRIISNLLSNAVKFTPAEGDIHLRLTHIPADPPAEERIELQVQDTGIGIPEAQLEQVFERFYQVDGSMIREGEGTGIGLSLTRELVKLLSGEIRVRSELNRGTTFTVSLPVSRKATRGSSSWKENIQALPAISPTEEIVLSPESETEDDAPRLLIIEDNPNVVKYLVACLDKRFALSIARDGQEGIEKAFELTPDIIITDVMMPRKNGYEVVETLKLDERTSHIPMVMLTARADQASKLEGYKRGADAFLPKPFDQAELEIRLSQLLEIRKKLQARYRQSLEPGQPSEDPQIQAEDAFILQARQYILDHLDEATYRGESLMKDLGLSRTNLHRKLKALTGLSTSKFVRAVRLEEAVKLLRKPDLNISEIAYRTGFNDPNYFHRVFAEEKGYGPGEWRQQHIS